jgi:hypothetical protein
MCYVIINNGAWAAPGRVYTTGARAAPGLVWTRGACADPGRVYTTRALAAPESVWKIGACAGLEIATPQGPELHSDMSGQKETVLVWTCLHPRRLSCTWTCLRYRGLYCTWACLQHRSLEVCPLGNIGNSVHGNYHGIPRNFVRLCDMEFHEIPRNFRQFSTEYGSTKNRWNSVDTLNGILRGLGKQNHEKNLKS